MQKRRVIWLTALLCLGMMVSVSAQARTPIEMLRDMFRKPVTEWKNDLQSNNRLLTKDFFTNVERRIRWGIENNHVDDALRFAMVGDFGAEVKRRPANFRIDLAELFFKAENYAMTGQIVDNIIISSPGTPAAKKAKFLRARLLEMKGELFDAHLTYVELAEKGHRVGESWYKAAYISKAVQQEARAMKEAQKSANAGYAPGKKLLADLKAEIEGDWTKILPPAPNSSTTTGLKPTGTSPKGSSSAGTVKMLVAQGKLKEGIVAYDKLLASDPKNLSHLQGQSALYYRSGDLEGALLVLNRALATYPNDVKLLRFRANTYERRFDRKRSASDLTAALADYRKASALAPNDEILKLELRRATDKV